MTDDVHAVAASRLTAAGQRYTARRREVVATLASAVHPMSIPEILEGRPGLAQSSLYRNLAVLEEAGVVHRIVTAAEHARFELSEDLTAHHHHLICTVCGAVQDFTAPAGLERTMRRFTGEVAGETGFTLEHHRIDLVGRCPRCA